MHRDDSQRPSHEAAASAGPAAATEDTLIVSADAAVALALGVGVEEGRGAEHVGDDEKADGTAADEHNVELRHPPVARRPLRLLQRCVHVVLHCVLLVLSLLPAPQKSRVKRPVHEDSFGRTPWLIITMFGLS